MTPTPDPEPPAAATVPRVRSAGGAEPVIERPTGEQRGVLSRDAVSNPPERRDAPEVVVRSPFPIPDRRDWSPPSGDSQREFGPDPAPPPLPEAGRSPWPAHVSIRDRIVREADAAEPVAPVPVSWPAMTPHVEPAARPSPGRYETPRIRPVAGTAPWPALPHSVLTAPPDDQEDAWLDPQVRGADPLADEQRSV